MNKLHFFTLLLFLVTFSNAQENKYFISTSGGSNIIGPFNKTEYGLSSIVNDPFGVTQAVIEHETSHFYCTSSLKAVFF